MGWMIRVQFLEWALMGFLSLASVYRPGLDPTQPLIQWVLDALILQVKCPGMKLITHLYQVPRLRMRGAKPLLPQYVLMAWYLVKHRDNISFPFICVMFSYLKIVV
jgi:hypothetical protein